MAARDDSPFGRLLTYFFLALLFVGALKLAFFVLGAAVGIGSFLIFTLGPILLVGWIIARVFRLFEPRR